MIDMTWQPLYRDAGIQSIEAEEPLRAFKALEAAE